MARLSVLQLYKKCQELTDAATSMGFSVVQKSDYYVWNSKTLGTLAVYPLIDNTVKRRTIEKIHKDEGSNVVIMSLSDATPSFDSNDWDWLTPMTLTEIQNLSGVFHETPDKFSFAWNLYFHNCSSQKVAVPENIHDDPSTVKTGRYYSWEIVDAVTAYKTCDASFFKYHGSGVPLEISWFFDADSFISGDSHSLSFEYEGSTYQGRVVNSSTSGRCIQIYWKRALGKLFESFSSIDGIRAKFTKVGNLTYSIVFIGKDNGEINLPLTSSKSAPEKIASVKSKPSSKKEKNTTKKSIIPDNISRLLDQALQSNLINDGKQSLLCAVSDTYVLYFYSKEYEKANNVKEYWYSIRENQNMLLSAHKDSYCAFDMPAIESLALIPYSTIEKILPRLPTSPHGGDPYWHVKIRYNGERFWLLTSGRERYAPNEKLYLDSPELEIRVLRTATPEIGCSDVLTVGAKKIKIGSSSMKEIKIKGGK